MQFVSRVLVYSPLTWVFLTSRVFTFKHFPSPSWLSESKVSMHLFFSGNHDKSHFKHHHCILFQVHLLWKCPLHWVLSMFSFDLGMLPVVVLLMHNAS